MGTSNRHGSITLRSGDAVSASLKTIGLLGAGLAMTGSSARLKPPESRSVHACLFGHHRYFSHFVSIGKVLPKKVHSFSVLRPFCQTQRSKIRDVRQIPSCAKPRAGVRCRFAKYARCAAEISRSDSSAHRIHLSAIRLHTALSSGVCVNLAISLHSAANVTNFSDGFIGYSLGCRAAVADSSPPSSRSLSVSTCGARFHAFKTP
jgi:hypothetical protein